MKKLHGLTVVGLFFSMLGLAACSGEATDDVGSAEQAVGGSGGGTVDAGGGGPVPLCYACPSDVPSHTIPYLRSGQNRCRAPGTPVSTVNYSLAALVDCNGGGSNL